jgi:hypothetical protein
MKNERIAEIKARRQVVCEELNQLVAAGAHDMQEEALADYVDELTAEIDALAPGGSATADSRARERR